MGNRHITREQVKNRVRWIHRLSKLSGDFESDSNRIEQELKRETREHGTSSLLGHLRLCGAIPECYVSDSTEEKLYSKYTDIVIHEAYNAMGFTSIVLKQRADVADVECTSRAYSFVADAKAFRLSRTAKNQKDFKIEAMDRWKHGKPYAMVVCPVYQLPKSSSQIYQQAIARSVCIATYTHLAVLIRCTKEITPASTKELVHEIFKSVEAMNPSKDAMSYWGEINRTLLGFDRRIRDIWLDEKRALSESFYFAKKEALEFLAMERERIMKLSRDDAIKEVLKARKLENKIKKVQSVAGNRLLDIENGN